MDNDSELKIKESSLEYIKSLKCKRCCHYTEADDKCDGYNIDAGLMTECCKSHRFDKLMGYFEHGKESTYYEIFEHLDYEWLFCSNCKLFDGYDICLCKKNFGTVTGHSVNKCIEEKYFIKEVKDK